MSHTISSESKEPKNKKTNQEVLKRPLMIEAMEDRVLYDAAPVTTVNAPSNIQIGETVDVSVSFDNVNNIPGSGETGFGPWVDIFIDATGEDGQVDPSNPSNPQIGDTDEIGPGDEYDGLSLSGTPTFLGAALEHTLLTLDDTANGGLGILHPYAVDSSGDSVYISTSNPLSPYFSELNGNYTSGDQILVVELPFGSFTEDQPVANIDFQLTLSDKADLGQSLAITTLGGFRFGQDALDNPLTDPSTIGVANTATASIDATLAQLNKTYTGPENETATGPNFERTYRIDIDVANGQSLADVNVYDELPDNIQFVSVTGSQAITVESTPSTTVPGGTLQVSFDAAVDGNTDAWVEVTFYVPRLDASGDVIINADSANDVFTDNQAYGFGSWTPIDPRDDQVFVGFDVDGAFDGTDLASALSTAAPDADPEHANLELAALTIQKGSTIVVENPNGATGSTPGDVVEYTLNFQVSDYFAFENLVIEDLISDGLRVDSTFTPTLLINGNTYVLGAAGWTNANYTVSQNFTGAVASGNFVVDPAANDGTPSDLPYFGRNDHSG